MFSCVHKLELVLFDFDGTLVNSEKVHKEIWSDLLQKFSRNSILQESDYLGLPAAQIAANLFQDREVATQAHKLFEVEELRRNYQWMGGAKEFVQSLHAQGLKLAIVTNSRRQKVDNFLREEGAAGLFSFIVACEDVEDRKPHSQPYQLAIRKSGIATSNIIAIEDSQTGIASAQAAGLNFLHVQPKPEDTAQVWMKLLEVTMSQEQNQQDRAALVLWNFHNAREELTPCDVIVGLGSYDQTVAEECADLLQKGMGKKIIFSGKEGNWTAGKSHITEAEHFARIAESRGVSPDKIVLEKEAINIGQNISFSKKIMDEYNWKSAIFVTKPQTTRRTRLTINKQLQVGHTLVSSPDYTMDTFIQKFGRQQLFNEMVGDLDRIIRYPEMGFQEAIMVPEDVVKAFEHLKQEGFTEHLVRVPAI